MFRGGKPQAYDELSQALAGLLLLGQGLVELFGREMPGLGEKLPQTHPFSHYRSPGPGRKSSRTRRSPRRLAVVDGGIFGRAARLSFYRSGEESDESGTSGNWGRSLPSGLS